MGAVRSHVLAGLVIVGAVAVLGFGALLATRPEMAFWGVVLLACLVFSYVMLGRTESGDLLEYRFAAGFGAAVIGLVVWLASLFLEGDAALLGALLLLLLLLLAFGRGSEARH